MTRGTRVRVREANVTELTDVLNVLDGSALATDREAVNTALARGDTLVAVTVEGHNGSTAAGDSSDSERILGALVLDGEEITAIAVRRRRRNQGIGTALVEAASQRRDRLIAAFDPGVRAFWDALGFDISRIPESDRYRGVR